MYVPLRVRVKLRTATFSCQLPGVQSCVVRKATYSPSIGGVLEEIHCGPSLLLRHRISTQSRIGEGLAPHPAAQCAR